MTENTVDEGPRRKQVKSTKNPHDPWSDESMWEPLIPVCHESESEAALEPGRLYSRQVLLRRLGIGPTTLATWIRGGLDAHSPETNRQYFIADEVMSYMKSDTAKRKTRSRT